MASPAPARPKSISRPSRARLKPAIKPLIMLPEIALTSQFLDRFERRFGVQPVEWHSALSPAERGRIWKGVARGDVRCVVGARSALFLPFPISA